MISQSLPPFIKGRLQYFLEYGEKSLGCPIEIEFAVNLDDKEDEFDKVYHSKGVKIVCDIRSVLYLMGTVLDFSDGINGKGFQFNNPNATRTCGCGESFSD